MDHSRLTWVPEKVDVLKIPPVVTKNFFIHDTIRDRVISLLKQNPEGIWANQFLELYHRTQYHKLDPRGHGFTCTIDMVFSLPHIFGYIRPDPFGDYLLFYQEAPVCRHRRRELKLWYKQKLDSVPVNIIKAIIALLGRCDESGVPGTKVPRLLIQHLGIYLSATSHGFVSINAMLMAMYDQGLILLERKDEALFALSWNESRAKDLHGVVEKSPLVDLSVEAAFGETNPTMEKAEHDKILLRNISGRPRDQDLLGAEFPLVDLSEEATVKEEKLTAQDDTKLGETSGAQNQDNPQIRSWFEILCGLKINIDQPGDKVESTPMVCPSSLAVSQMPGRPRDQDLLGVEFPLVDLSGGATVKEEKLTALDDTNLGETSRPQNQDNPQVASWFRILCGLKINIDEPGDKVESTPTACPSSLAVSQMPASTTPTESDSGSATLDKQVVTKMVHLKHVILIRLRTPERDRLGHFMAWSHIALGPLKVNLVKRTDKLYLTLEEAARKIFKSKSGDDLIKKYTPKMGHIHLVPVNVEKDPAIIAQLQSLDLPGLGPNFTDTKLIPLKCVQDIALKISNRSYSAIALCLWQAMKIYGPKEDCWLTKSA